MLVCRRSVSVYTPQVLVCRRSVSVYTPQMLVCRRSVSVYTPQVLVCRRSVSVYTPQVLVCRRSVSVYTPQVQVCRRSVSVYTPQVLVCRRSVSAYTPQVLVCRRSVSVYTPQVQVCRRSVSVYTPQVLVCRWSASVYTPQVLVCRQTVPVYTPQVLVCRRSVSVYTPQVQLGRLVSESACEWEDPGSNPAADMVDAARNTAWDLGHHFYDRKFLQICESTEWQNVDSVNESTAPTDDNDDNINETYFFTPEHRVGGLRRRSVTDVRSVKKNEQTLFGEMNEAFSLSQDFISTSNPVPATPKLNDGADSVANTNTDENKNLEVDAKSDKEAYVWSEDYCNRTDLMIHRTVFFKLRNPKHPVEGEAATRVVCEYDAPLGDTEPHKTVCRRQLDLESGCIQLLYHYWTGRLDRRWITIQCLDDTTPLALTQDVVNTYQPDPTERETPLEELRPVVTEELKNRVLLKQDLLAAAEELERVRNRRMMERHNQLLQPSVFMVDRHETALRVLEKERAEAAQRPQIEAKKALEQQGIVDVIEPYLALLDATGTAARTQKQSLQEVILRDAERRYELRANLLQQQLDQAHETLSKIQEEREATSQRPGLSTKVQEPHRSREAQAEATHRRLTNALNAWVSEATVRHALLREALAEDQRLQ
ncbi:hypothetical protein FHG87_003181 [Trinorchestia longiramus]|nr:hypothetical protein FHG87_003181 [Trinorchestia longiramus]